MPINTMEGLDAWNVQYLRHKAVSLDDSVEEPVERIVIAPSIAEAVKALEDFEAPNTVDIFKVAKAVPGADILVVSDAV